ncbi:MAG: DMT family transporter [Spirochaetales bacterium]|nr:DMT family transporter [Spirochaetales bacterium]
MKSKSSRLLAVFACFLWSTAFMGVKTGLDSMPPMLFAGVRFTLAGLAVALFYRKPGKIRQLKSHWRQLLLVGFFQTFSLYALFFYSLTMMRASTGAIVNGIGPMVVALGAHFFLPGSRLRVRQFLCLVLGAAGVVLVAVSGTASGSAEPEYAGILLMFMSLLVGATASILVAKSSSDLDPFLLNAGQLTAGGLGLLLFALILGDRPYDGIQVFHFSLALGWLVFVSAAAFSIWYYLLKVRKEALSSMAVWRFLIPVSGAALSWIFMADDSPDLLSAAGMALTGFSIYQFYRVPEGRKETVGES